MLGPLALGAMSPRALSSCFSFEVRLPLRVEVLRAHKKAFEIPFITCSYCLLYI